MRTADFRLAVWLWAAVFAVAAIFVATEAAIVRGRYRNPEHGEHRLDWALDTDRERIQFTIARLLPPVSSNFQFLQASAADLPSMENQTQMLAAASAQWFAIALNPSHAGMRVTDMIFVRAKIRPDTGAPECEFSDRYANRPDVPLTDQEQQGTNDVLLETTEPLFQYDAQSKQWQVICVVSRALDTGDPFDYPIHNATMQLGVAYGAVDEMDRFQKHAKGTVRAMMLNFFQPFDNTNGGDKEGTDKRWKSLFFWHGVLLVVAWYLLMVPGVWLARYFKVMIPAWFKYHWMVQAIAFTMVTVGIAFAVIAENFEFVVSLHTVLGLTLFLLMIAQVGLGYLSNALWFPSKPPHFWPDKLHWYVGRAVLLAGMVNIYYGTSEFDEHFPFRTVAGWSLAVVMAVVAVGATVLMEFGMGQQHEHEHYHSVEEEQGDQTVVTAADAEHGLTLVGSTSVTSPEEDEAEGKHRSSQEGLLSPEGQMPVHRRPRFRWSKKVAMVFLAVTLVKLASLVVGYFIALVFG